MALKATQWASVADQIAALERWPRNIPDADHVAAIQREIGLSWATCKLALDLARGDTEGDCVTVQ